MCGHTPTRDENICISGLIEGRKYWIQCNCGLQTPMFKSMDKLLKYWNSRYTDFEPITGYGNLHKKIEHAEETINQLYKGE